MNKLPNKLKKRGTLIRTRKRNLVSAFTLIELLIVVAILGVLAAFVVVRFVGPQNAANDAKRQSDLRQYQSSLEVYANRSNSLYPSHTSTTTLNSMCGTTELNIPNCPGNPKPSLGSGYNYNYQSNAGRTTYVVWARLEKKPNSTQDEHFVLCSTGQAGKATSATGAALSVSGGSCPI